MSRILICLILLLPCLLPAQTVLTLEEAVQKALEKNYDIRLTQNDLQAYALDQEYANAAFLPRLNGTASKVWNSNSQRQTFTDGTERERDDIRSTNLASAINLNWTIFDGMKMFVTRDKLEEFKKLGELAVKNQVVLTISDVTARYYNIVQAKQQVSAISEQISINEERVKLAERKISVGLGSKPELLQASVDLNAQKASMLQQQTLIAQLREQLNQLMGDPVDVYFDVTDSIPINLDLQYGDLATSLDASSPALQVARKNIDLARLTVRERKAERWLVINFNSPYKFTRLDNTVVINPFQPLFSLNRGLNYGLSATVPILNGFNTRRMIRQAELDVQYQELFYQNQRSQIDLSLSNAYRNYQYQIKALRLEEENIELARENVSIALERFRQGVSTYLELREAQISLSDSYNRLIAARYNTKVAETDLLRLKGSIIDGYWQQND